HAAARGATAARRRPSGGRAAPIRRLAQRRARAALTPPAPFALGADSGDHTQPPVRSSAMTEANKLDEPLSESDYDELEVFLGSTAVPQDCMDLEMLDGFLPAVVSGPELIQPSEWLPVVWSDSQRTVTPVFQNNEQAERILSLVLRLQQSIRRTLAESPTRFKP